MGGAYLRIQTHRLGNNEVGERGWECQLHFSMVLYLMKSFHCIHGIQGEGSYKMKLEKILRNIMALEMGISLHPEFREHLF